jgi:hypothetical protein
MADVTLDNVDDVFTYYPPKTDFVKDKYHRLRLRARAAARAILGPYNAAPIDPVTSKPQENWLSYRDWLTRHLHSLDALFVTEVGDCNDQREAFSCLSLVLAALPSERKPTDDERQRAIKYLRAALMWANAAIALEAKI